MKRLVLSASAFIIAITLFSCGQTSNQATEEVAEANPAADGFNLEASDAQAIAVADEVMEAMGGREAWDNTRYICWKFFGRDALIWDKWSGNVRIDRPDGLTLLSNIHDGTGKAFRNGNEITESDSITFFMERAKRIWINHSYWLVMPYKLKDSGVTLKAMGEDTTQKGAMCDKLMLTFEEVGVTPQNKYEIWVDKESRLVSQWAYYRNVDDAKPSFTMPWAEYKKHGEIMLSRFRGENRNMEDIMVFDELPESVFTSPEKPNLSQSGT